ncbi:unnamed protein product, partial [Oppiella nova]
MSANSHYKQIQVFNYSTNFAEATKIVSLHLVDPKSDEILVKNLFVGINATDLNITAGRYFKHDDPPYPLGFEYVTSADGLTVIPKPDPEYLALFGTSGLTASIGLSEGSHLASGEKVLITAAAGGVGHIAAQWALLKGCHVIATTSNDKKQE